jgi:Tfp pilus assembly protein PilN
MSSDQSMGGASFLPADYVQRKTELRNNIITLTLFALAMGVVAVTFFMKDMEWRKVRDQYVAVNEAYEAEGQKIEQLKQLEAQRAQMMEKAQITSALVERIPRWAVLGEIHLRMPRTMWLETFEVKSTRNDAGASQGLPLTRPAGVQSLTDGAAAAAAEKKIVPPSFSYQMTILGSAERNNDVADFLTSLKRSPIFKNVELTFIRESREGEKVVRRFEILTSLRTEVEQKVLLASLEKLVADRQREIAKEESAAEQRAQGVSAVKE